MAKYASEVIKQAKAWLGLKESNGGHKEILNTYNNHRPLARNYKMTASDPWCATFVSAVAIKLGYTDIMPTECSCTNMIAMYKKLGSWQENENVTPKPGWIIFYDWDDKSNYKTTDNKGGPEHVGIVEKVANGKITIIEGNHDGDDADRIDGVERRVLAVNGRYIRGYGVPKYDEEKGTTSKEVQTTTTSSNKSEVCEVKVKELKNGSKGDQVKALQLLLIGNGISCGRWKADGSFGSATETAVKAYQKKKKLTVDGIVGTNTWNKLLGN